MRASSNEIYADTKICELPGIFAPYVMCLTRKYRGIQTSDYDQWILVSALSWGIVDEGKHVAILETLAQVQVGESEKKTLETVAFNTGVSVSTLLNHITETLEENNFPYESYLTKVNAIIKLTL